MAGTFFGINVAQSGLMAQRLAMDVMSMNIANANDPTYKRQRLLLRENTPLAQAQDATGLGVQVIGGGVSTGQIQRVRDALIENRLRLATGSSAQWEYTRNVLTQVESVLAEPTDSGLLADLDQFWAAWNKVATSPDSLPIRNTLIEDAAALCARIQYTYTQIANVQDDLNLATRSRVDQINQIAGEIATINQEITYGAAGQAAANRLLDRRDAMVIELSKIVSITQHGEGSDDFILSIGGHVIVQGIDHSSVTSAEDADGREILYWENGGDEVVVQGGELKAMYDLNGTLVPDYLSRLDDLATSLVTEVNNIHTDGMDFDGNPGVEFFTAGSTAANISLNSALVGHPELVAASATGARGNGYIALQIAELQQPNLAGGMSIDEIYRALVGTVGGAASSADRQAEAQSLSLQQFTTQQQSVSGVSLDEEMANMIKFQQAYNAAARMLTVMDEMLGVLIERTGVVGR